MKRLARLIIVLACAVAILAAALDVRCVSLRPADDTLIIACRAGRLDLLAGRERWR
jgi:hypothetical protein